MRRLTGKPPCVRHDQLLQAAIEREPGVDGLTLFALRPSRLSLWAKKCVDADERPGNFNHDEPDLKGMEGNAPRDWGTDRVQDGVAGPVWVHPARWVPGVGDEDPHRAQKGRSLPPHRDFHRGLFYRESCSNLLEDARHGNRKG